MEVNIMNEELKIIIKAIEQAMNSEVVVTAILILFTKEL
jgi:hypothetical protein